MPVFQKGQVVRALRGRDADSFFAVVDVAPDGTIFIADGRRRKLASPKRKNPKHIAATKHTLPAGGCPTDRSLRRLLGQLAE